MRRRVGLAFCSARSRDCAAPTSSARYQLRRRPHLQRVPVRRKRCCTPGRTSSSARDKAAAALACTWSTIRWERLPSRVAWMLSVREACWCSLGNRVVPLERLILSCSTAKARCFSLVRRWGTTSLPGRSCWAGRGICSAGWRKARWRCGSIDPTRWPMPPKRTARWRGVRLPGRSCSFPETLGAVGSLGGNGGGIDLPQRPPGRRRNLVVDLLSHHLLQPRHSSLGGRPDFLERHGHRKPNRGHRIVERIYQGGYCRRRCR